MRCSRILQVFGVVVLSAGLVATTFPVTKTNDANDGACDADCSLREAIEAANTNPGADDVPVPAGSYLLTLGRLVISDDVNVAGVAGTNTRIEGNLGDRILAIRPGIVAEISNLGIHWGYGGIYNQGDLNLTNVVVSSNFQYYNGAGAGIYNGPQAVLTLTDSIVRYNDTGIGSADADGSGGGIYNRGVLTLTNSTVSGNFAREKGGGIYNAGGDITLIDSTVSENTARWGGGVYTRSTDICDYCGYEIEGRATLNNSLVTGNSSLDGAGIVVFGYWSAGFLTLMNSTVSGNEAGRSGGGMLARLVGVGDGYEYDFPVILINSTLSGNTGTSGAGILLEEGDPDSFEVTNTIIADNAGSASGNCSEPIHSLGHNLADDDSCGFTEPGDLVVADAMLGPLADNGGPTQTHALLPGSPAIDAGSPDCPPPDTDERGVARPQGSACDIGAFEFGPIVIPAEIDIQPGSDSNPIYPNRRGILPVAILGSATFDVADVDVTTLAFGPDGATPNHDLTDPSELEDHLGDVNEDGLLDLVSHYRVEEIGITPGDFESCMPGKTSSGTPFEGCDSIRTLRGRRGFRR